MKSAKPTVNIILVKFGTKYSSKHVNKMIEQLEPYVKGKFWCYTDDPVGVNCECIPPIRKPRVKKWWNKIALFSNTMPFEGDCVLFDLDLVVKDDPTPFLTWSKVPTLVSSYHKVGNPKYDSPLAFDTYYNSSIITWKAGSVDHIWRHFVSNSDYFTRKYKGIDRWFRWERISVNTFKDGILSNLENPIEAPILSYEGVDYVV